MLKTIRDMLVGALVAAGITAAFASVGQMPLPGFQTPDGSWLLGLGAGVNYTYQYGITAHAGGTQSAALVLPAQYYLLEVDTVATAADSVALPQCLQGTQFFLANAGANTLDVYGNPTTNPITGTADTINATAGSTAYTLSTNTNAYFFCAKNGSWKAVKGS